MGPPFSGLIYDLAFKFFSFLLTPIPYLLLKSLPYNNISLYQTPFFFIFFFYDCLSSFLGSIYSLSKCLGLFITKILTDCNGFSRPIPIKRYLWCIPVKQFK